MVSVANTRHIHRTKKDLLSVLCTRNLTFHLLFSTNPAEDRAKCRICMTFIGLVGKGRGNISVYRTDGKFYFSSCIYCTSQLYTCTFVDQDKKRQISQRMRTAYTYPCACACSFHSELLADYYHVHSNYLFVHIAREFVFSMQTSSSALHSNPPPMWCDD